MDPALHARSHLGFMTTAHAINGPEGRRGSADGAQAETRSVSETSATRVHGLTPPVRVDLPWDYKLPATTVRILADIVVATMQSRDRPPEVA